MHGRYLGIVDDEWGPQAAWHAVRDDRVEAAISGAVERGARGFVLPRRFQGAAFLEGMDGFFTDSTLDFGLRAAEVILANRGNSRLTVISGSAGKSTTRAMLSRAMGAILAKDELSPTKGINNSMTSVVGLLSQTDAFGHFVMEVAGGMLATFRQRSFSMNADVAILTSIAQAHLELHGDVAGVVRNKSEIFSAPPPRGVAIVNLDTRFADELVRRATQVGRKVVTYGRKRGATIRLVDYDAVTGQVRAKVNWKRITYTVGARGEHMALNSLAVLATLRAYEMPNWREGIAALADFEAVKGRGDSHDLTLESGVRVKLIDESYNANPASMRVALKAFAESSGANSGRRVAILGDMLELADDTEAAHRELAGTVQAARLDEVHLVGEHMAYLYEELRALRGVRYWKDVRALVRRLPNHLQQGDIVLAKASRATGLHRALRKLVEASEHGAEQNL